MVGAGLGQADVGEDSVDEVAGHVLGGLRVVVESGNGGEDGGAGVGGKLHVAEVDAVEGCLADAEDERPLFFEADVGGALDEVGGEAVGDGGEGAHGTGKDDHGGGGVAAAGDVGADVGVGVLLEPRAGGTDKLFCEVVTAAQIEFFGEYPECAFGGYEVDFFYSCILCEGAEDFGGVDGATSSGYGQRDVVGWGHGIGSSPRMG